MTIRRFDRKDEIGPLTRWEKVEDSDGADLGDARCRHPGLGAAFTEVELPDHIRLSTRTGRWSSRDVSPTGRVRDERHEIKPLPASDAGERMRNRMGVINDAIANLDLTTVEKRVISQMSGIPPRRITDVDYWNLLADDDEIVEWHGRYWEKIVEHGISTWREVTLARPIEPCEFKSVQEQLESRERNRIDGSRKKHGGFVVELETTATFGCPDLATEMNRRKELFDQAASEVSRALQMGRTPAEALNGFVYDTGLEFPDGKYAVTVDDHTHELACKDNRFGVKDDPRQGKRPVIQKRKALNRMARKIRSLMRDRVNTLAKNAVECGLDPDDIDVHSNNLWISKRDHPDNEDDSS